MQTHQARLNARRIFQEKYISPTTGAALHLLGDFACFAALVGALVFIAHGTLRLSSGELQDLHAQVEARRGW